MIKTNTKFTKRESHGPCQTLIFVKTGIQESHVYVKFVIFLNLRFPVLS